MLGLNNANHIFLFQGIEKYGGIFHSPNPWDPSGVGTGRAEPTAHTEAHSVTGRFSFLCPVSSGVRGDHLLGHPEQEKDGLSSERGIKRRAASIYAAKALYRPDTSEATFAVTDEQANRKIPLAETNQTAIFG